MTILIYLLLATVHAKPCVATDYDKAEWVDPQSKKFLELFTGDRPRKIKPTRTRIELWSFTGVAESPGFNPLDCRTNFRSAWRQTSGPKVAIEVGAVVRGPLTVGKYEFVLKIENAAGTKEIPVVLNVAP